MRISDWSSDVCTSDLRARQAQALREAPPEAEAVVIFGIAHQDHPLVPESRGRGQAVPHQRDAVALALVLGGDGERPEQQRRIAAAEQKNRKGGLEGTRVSLRVQLDWIRIFIKK